MQIGNFDLEVGFVYKISSFKVIPNDRPVRLTNNRFRLLFNAETNIFLSGDPSIPREAWSFFDSAEIERSRGTFPHLIGIFRRKICILLVMFIFRFVWVISLIF